MKSLTLVLLITACSARGAVESGVRLALGTPTRNKAVEGLLDYPAKLTNTRKESVWVYSVTGESTWLYYSAQTRRNNVARWDTLPYAMCGVGATEIELKPGASFSFKTVAPADDGGNQYRIEVSVRTSRKADAGVVDVTSHAVKIPKVIPAEGK